MNMAKDGESQLDGTQDNDKILKMVKEKDPLVGIIVSRQRHWLDHIMRGDSPVRTLFEGRMEVKGQDEDWMRKEDYNGVEGERAPDGSHLKCRRKMSWSKCDDQNVADKNVV